MIGRRRGECTLVTSTLVFWWGVCLVIQSAERMFLVATTVTREPATADTLATTLRAGFRADLMGAAGGIVIAVVLGLVIGAGLAITKRWRKGRAVLGSPWKAGITIGAVGVALLILVVATADMAYYRYSRQRVDIVFLESVIDVFSPATHARPDSSLVGRQAAAQLADGARWVGYAATFAGAMAMAIVAWWLAFTRAAEPLLCRCIAAARGASRLHWCWRWSPRAPVSTANQVRSLPRFNRELDVLHAGPESVLVHLGYPVSQAIEVRVAGTEARCCGRCRRRRPSE